MLNDQLKIERYDYKIFYISLIITTQKLCSKFTNVKEKGIELYHYKIKTQKSSV